MKHDSHKNLLVICLWLCQCVHKNDWKIMIMVIACLWFSSLPTSSASSKTEKWAQEETEGPGRAEETGRSPTHIIPKRGGEAICCQWSQSTWRASRRDKTRTTSATSARVSSWWDEHVGGKSAKDAALVTSKCHKVMTRARKAMLKHNLTITTQQTQELFRWNNSCVCYVVTRSTSPPGKYWAPSSAFIHWKPLI